MWGLRRGGLRGGAVLAGCVRRSPAEAPAGRRRKTARLVAARARRVAGAGPPPTGRAAATAHRKVGRRRWPSADFCRAPAIVGRRRLVFGLGYRLDGVQYASATTRDKRSGTRVGRAPAG